ncbi:MAG: hypothetical protein KBA72_00420 [Thermoanaerobaculia bacterium]|nr:hypothetical protein [Thermoanaerobaculia bacterium]
MNGARRFEIWLGFAGVGAIATLLLGVAGQMMARRIGLQELGGIWVGCLASFAGSLAGAVPLAQEVAGSTKAPAGRSPSAAIAAIGKASLWRLLVSLAAGLAAVTSGRWERRTLLFALATSYVALLAVETWWLLGRLRAAKT